MNSKNIVEYCEPSCQRCGNSCKSETFSYEQKRILEQFRERKKCYETIFWGLCEECKEFYQEEGKKYKIDNQFLKTGNKIFTKCWKCSEEHKIVLSKLTSGNRKYLSDIFKGSKDIITFGYCFKCAPLRIKELLNQLHEEKKKCECRLASADFIFGLEEDDEDEDFEQWEKEEYYEEFDSLKKQIIDVADFISRPCYYLSSNFEEFKSFYFLSGFLGAEASLSKWDPENP